VSDTTPSDDTLSADNASAAEANPSADELRSAALHGVRWSSIGRPATEVLLLGSMVVLARLIPPAEFGRYAVALIAGELASVVASEGVGGALIQRANCRREHLQTGVALGMIIGLALACLVLVGADLIVAPIFGSRTALYVALMAPLCLIAAASTVPMALLSRRMAFRRLSEIEVLSTLVRVAACVGLALAGLGGEALVFGMIAGGLTIAVISWISAPPPMPRLRREPARELLHFGLPASLAGVSWIGFRNSDYAIVGARLGVFEAGLYFRAYTLAIDYQKKVSMVMGQVGFPLLSRTRGPAEMADMRRKMVHLLTVTLFPLLVLLAIGSPVLVPFLFGPKWDGMIVPAQILAVGGAATLVIDAAGTVLMATGRTRSVLGYGLAHWIVYGTSVFLVVRLGIVAVAIDAAVVHALFLVVAYVLMLSGSGEPPLKRLWGDIAPATVSCLGLAAVAVPASIALSAAHIPSILWLAALGLLAVPPYLLTLRLGFPETWRSLGGVLEQFLPERLRFPAARRRLAAAARSAA
jgi:O-antigen/teichoic acid export membrane protein